MNQFSLHHSVTLASQSILNDWCIPIYISLPDYKYSFSGRFMTSMFTPLWWPFITHNFLQPVKEMGICFLFTFLYHVCCTMSVAPNRRSSTNWQGGQYFTMTSSPTSVFHNAWTTFCPVFKSVKLQELFKTIFSTILPAFLTSASRPIHGVLSFSNYCKSLLYRSELKLSGNIQEW